MIHRHLEGEPCNASCTPAPTPSGRKPSLRVRYYNVNVPPINRVASYPKAEWSRGEAWMHLHAQRFPGAPQRPINEATGHWGHGWTKAHTAFEWRWIYWHPEGCEHGVHWTNCEFCKDRS